MKRKPMTNHRACMIIADWAMEHDRDNYNYYKEVASKICYWHLIYVPTGKTSHEVYGPWRRWLKRNHRDIYKIVWPNE